MQMKKLLPYILLTVSIFGFTSCNDSGENDPDMFVDYIHVYFNIAVENNNGENLLDPQTDGNILSLPMSIIYEGEESPLIIGASDEVEEYATRALPCTWYGGFISSYFPGDEPIVDSTLNRIYIGQFMGGIEGTKDVKLVISNKVYDLSFTTKKNGWKVESYKFYMNGELIQDNNLPTGYYKIIL